MIQPRRLGNKEINTAVISIDAALTLQPVVGRCDDAPHDTLTPIGGDSYAAVVAVGSAYMANVEAMGQFNPHKPGSFWLPSGAVVVTAVGEGHKGRYPQFIVGRHVDDGNPRTASVVGSVYELESDETLAARLVASGASGYDTLPKLHEVSSLSSLQRLQGLLDAILQHNR